MVAIIVAVGATMGAPRSAMANASPEEAARPVPVLFTGIRAGEAHGEIAAAAEARVARRLEERGRVEVVTNWELGRVVDVHVDQILAGCEEACGEAVDIIGALEAPLLLVGQLHSVGGLYDLSLTLIETGVGRVRARAVGDASSERALVVVAEDLAWSLLRQAELVRPGLDAAGFEVPRFHVALKAGNSLARAVRVDGVRGIHAVRLNVEGNYYVTERVLLFAEMGASFGRSRETDGEGVASIGIVPVGLGAKHLWTFDRTRLWAGGSLGAGFLGLFLGQTSDFRAAFSTSLVLGADYRVAARWAVLVEGSTSLTDAILVRARDRDLDVPILAGVTVGVARLIP